jgi:L-arabinokinase
LRTIVFYISGHGFGHAARDIEVINSILQRRDDVRVIVRTSAPEWLFTRTVRSPYADRFTRVEGETDTGVVQIDSLTLDESQTVARARAFMQTFAARLEAEAGFLREHHAHFVVSDIPALGIAAPASAGIPAAALGNFTWDWIYDAYAGAEDVARAIGEAYAKATCAIRLPMHGGFATFSRIIDIPFVARRSRRDPADTRRTLGLPLDRPVVLISFGGYGLERIDRGKLSDLEGYYILGTAAHPLDENAMYDRGLRYEDVVRAVDVVVTKPGYGIISECIANDAAILYTSRGNFVEYDVLVREMPRYLRAQFIDHDSLFAGDWRDALDGLMRQPSPPERAAVNGADIAADLLLDMI